MFKEERSESTFSWDLLGDIKEGRPNLGGTMFVSVYRLMQFTLRDVLIQEFGVQKADEIFFKSGEVAGRVNRSSKLLGGRLSFKLATARALLGWRDRRVRWRVDGGPWAEAGVTALSVCNARYFGGGMMVAPAARLDDGLLDVTVWSGLGLVDLVLKQPQLYDGRHVRLPNTRTLTARTVEVEPLEAAPVLLEVDGEQPGVLPARFEVLPGALALRGGAPA